MILYQAANYSQLMRCMVHKINYRLNEKAILLYPKENKRLAPHVCGKISSKKYKVFFDEVYYIDFQKMGYDEANIAKYADEIYHEDISYELHMFSEIVVSTPQFPFACYLAREKIPFSYMEEAIGAYGKQVKNEIDFRRAWPKQYEWGMKYGIFDLSNRNLIRCIYTENNDGVEDDRVFLFSFFKEFDKLNSNLRNLVVELFGKRCEIYSRVNKSALLISEAFSNGRFSSLKDEVLLYKNYLDYFAYPRQIIVKPHSSDMINYKKIFPHASVLCKDMPLELIEGVNSINDCLLLGFGSSVERSICWTNKLRFCKDFHERIIEIKEQLPQYYVIKEIFEYLNKVYPVRFLNLSIDDPLVDDFFRFNDDLFMKKELLLVYVGDGVKEKDVSKYLDMENAIIVFKALSYELVTLMYKYKDMITRKMITLIMDDKGDTDRRYLYIYTRNSRVEKMIWKFHHKRWLYHSQCLIEVKDDCLEGGVRKIEGMIDVGERYLSYLKEKKEILLMGLKNGR